MPLVTPETLPSLRETIVAREELKHFRAIADAFHADGLFDAPATLHDRVVALLPSLF